MVGEYGRLYCNEPCAADIKVPAAQHFGTVPNVCRGLKKAATLAKYSEQDSQYKELWHVVQDVQRQEKLALLTDVMRFPAELEKMVCENQLPVEARELWKHITAGILYIYMDEVMFV